MTPRRLAGVAAAIALLAAGCTTVPTNSVPQVVNRIGGTAQTGAPPITPPPGADPRTIVSDFLRASETNTANHQAARAFLTPDARTRWQDSTVTVLDSVTVNIPSSANGPVVVSGRQIGKISSSGIYQPTLTGDGSGDPTVAKFTFGMKLVAGQWRIDQLQPGILVDLVTFEGDFVPRGLFFFDLAEKHLVPDLRWTSITDPGALATWMVTQMVSGPRPELQNAVTSEFPAQLDPSRVTVTVGTQTVVDIPGASQLDGPGRTKLAAQLAATLVQVSSVNELTIADSGKPITIPQIGTSFTSADFPAQASPLIGAPSLFYLHNGGVVDETGHPLPGPVGNGNNYDLTSFAIATGSTADLRVAGVTGTGSGRQLWLGTVRNGLRRTALSGSLSRPAWAPGMDEVWLGDGKDIVRVGPDGKPIPVVPTLASGQQLGGPVTALRISPEGSRIAVVIAAADGSQVWIGSIVRTSAQVRIDALEPITPIGIAIKDVAWNDQLKLFVIGQTVTSGETNVYEVQSDGSLWTAEDVVNLPPTPDTITVAANQPAWVSAGGSVWVRRANVWASPGENTTIGTAPVYLE